MLLFLTEVWGPYFEIFIELEFGLTEMGTHYRQDLDFGVFITMKIYDTLLQNNNFSQKCENHILIIRH